MEMKTPPSGWVKDVRGPMNISRNLARAALLTLAAAIAVETALAAEGREVSLTVPEAAALELKQQLESTDAPGPLSVLGVEGLAELVSVVPVPMRDGVNLSAHLIIPKGGAAQKHPVILIRTPYTPASELSEPLAPPLLSRLIKDGYVIAVVNDRGTQWSEGRYHWLQGANDDGYDILEWITRQPWSSGKVGTFGCSSSGESQPPLATINHPAHKAMVEMAGATAAGTIPGYRDQGIFYHGGVPDLASQAARERIAAAFSPEPVHGMPDFAALASHLPSADILAASGAPATEWNRLIRLTPGSPDWKSFDFIREGDKTRVPGLHIDSWYDVIEAYPTVKMFQSLSRTSPNQHLVMGPTAHCHMGTETEATSVGDREVGDGRFDYVTMISQFFDRWLKDDVKAAAPAPVQYYVLNSSQWKTADAWPPPGGRSMRLFLGSDGHANSAGGDGRLSPQRPAGSAAADEFTDDPMHPVPSLGGSCCSDEVARDQSGIESRQDVLVYSSDPFKQTTRIVGDVTVSLSVGSSAPDTDFMVKLVDVDPAGHAYNLTDTALRMRYRNGYQSNLRMQPGQIYSVPITGMVTATDMLPGHRLRIEVAGTNFPNYERNLNTGGRNFDETAANVARNRVVHTARNASFIEYTVMPR
jgi:hypothetical protein